MLDRSSIKLPGSENWCYFITVHRHDHHTSAMSKNICFLRKSDYFGMCHYGGVAIYVTVPHNVTYLSVNFRGSWFMCLVYFRSNDLDSEMAHQLTILFF